MNASEEAPPSSDSCVWASARGRNLFCACALMLLMLTRSHLDAALTETCFACKLTFWRKGSSCARRQTNHTKVRCSRQAHLRVTSE